MKSQRSTEARTRNQGFVPCAPELAYCTDCRENRRQQACPRQRAWRKGDQRLEPPIHPTLAPKDER